MSIYDVKLVVKYKGQPDKKIASWRMDGKERLFVKFKLSNGALSDEVEIKQNNFVCVGGKRINPWFSYITNPWNVMLPYVTYYNNTPHVKEYLKLIGATQCEEEVI